MIAGRYRVESLLGEGNKKRVYLAHDERLGREVALAVLKTEGLDAEQLGQFHAEARAMARLGDHPHVVTIHDLGICPAPSLPSPWMAPSSATASSKAKSPRTPSASRSATGRTARWSATQQ